ncbi:RecX family transcriptional regulator [Candidatus Woesearchaeota archaeon]|nr:RecX family transcriptional regulator [Candidatus Woesearchaeota archaeon]
MTPLAQYIEAQLKNGYTSSQIKQYLIQQGYNSNDVDNALTELNQGQQAPQTQAQNVAQTQVSQDAIRTQLTSYVLTYLQQGYQPDQLFEYLKGQGYDPKMLKEVLSQINTQYYQGNMQSSILHEHSISGSSIAKLGMMLIIVALIVGGGYYFAQDLLFGSGSSNKLLDVTATPIKKQIKEGEPLSFSVELINQGENGEVDVFVDYIIRDGDSKIVDKIENTKSFDTSKEWIERIDLDGYESGLYRLEVSATYGGKYAESSFSFSYQANPEDIVPKVPDEPKETNPPETTTKNHDTTENKPNTQVEKPKAADAKGRDDEDLFDYAINQNSKDEALSYCTAISDNALKTECYYTVAQQNQESEICNLIETKDRKEDCYMNFVMLGDSDLCSEITLPENVQLCNQFTQLSKIKGYMENDNQEGLKDYLGVPDYEAQRPTEEEVQNKDPNLNDFSINDMI